MRTVHVVVPDGIDDPAEPSGGNVYDRRVCHGLAATGWSVDECPVPGSWPSPDVTARDALAARLSAVPDERVVLVDGLIGCAAPDLLLAEANRLRLVVLVHQPLGLDESAAPQVRAGERAVLKAVTGVVATSGWTRSWLVSEYALDPELVHVAEPGTDRARLAPGTGTGSSLLCVGAVTRGKGQDVLVEALSRLADLRWRCTCVGSLTREPALVEQVRRRAQVGGIGERVRWTGPLTGADLADAYAGADLLVLPSRADTYGMVVAEAVARGVPVVTTDVGGLPDTLGHPGVGARAGLLVPPGEPAPLAAVLRRWLTEPDLREQLRGAALQRRAYLTGWDDTTDQVTHVLRTLGHSERVAR